MTRGSHNCRLTNQTERKETKDYTTDQLKMPRAENIRHENVLKNLKLSDSKY